MPLDVRIIGRLVDARIQTRLHAPGHRGNAGDTANGDQDDAASSRPGRGRVLALAPGERVDPSGRLGGRVGRCLLVWASGGSHGVTYQVSGHEARTRPETARCKAGHAGRHDRSGSKQRQGNTVFSRQFRDRAGRSCQRYARRVIVGQRVDLERPGVVEVERRCDHVSVAGDACSESLARLAQFLFGQAKLLVCGVQLLTRGGEVEERSANVDRQPVAADRAAGSRAVREAACCSSMRDSRRRPSNTGTETPIPQVYTSSRRT